MCTRSDFETGRRLTTRRGFLAGAAAIGVAGMPRAGLAASAGLSAPALQALKATMQAHVASGYLPGAVWAIQKGNQTVIDWAGTFELGTGRPMKRDTLFRIASLTKPVTAALAMTYVEEGKLSLDGSVEDLLPELANRRVLKSIDGPLDDTVTATGPITLRQLLTMTFGLGAVMVFPEKYPIQIAMREAGIAPGFAMPKLDADGYMRALGGLPLATQPGQSFLYNNGLDVAGILIERVGGKRLGLLMKERIFDPLGMKDTAFFVGEADRDRLPTQYGPDFGGGQGLKVFGEAEGVSTLAPPPFDSGAGGLVSTAEDYLQFCRMMLAGGTLDGHRILGAEAVREMTRDQLTEAQRKEPNAQFFMFDGGAGWGLGMSVAHARTAPGMAPGRFGWDGGLGTSGYVDPERNVIGIFLSQRMMDSPKPPRTFEDFWTGVDKAVG